MWSFLTGLGSAVILAGVTLWVLEAGTITMPEATDNVSVRLEGIWQEQSPATMSVPLVTQGNVEE
jgi:hypothetical protein